MQNERSLSESEHNELSGFLNGDYSSHSWETHSDTIAEKKTDRSVFLHHGTGIPHKIRSFFGITDLNPGEHKPITLWYQNNHYDAYLKMTSLDSPRSQMHWRSDFSTILHTTYPKWFNFFRAGGMESDDTPSLKFVKRSTPNEYDLEFIEGSAPQTTPIAETPLKSGDTLTNEQLQKYFICSPQGGMRKSNTTKTLILTLDHVNPIYKDKWIDDILYYTGQGQYGDQELTRENKILAQSDNNGVRVVLFEKYFKNQYTFIGEVTLLRSPKIENQRDFNNQMRKVFVFPLKLKSGFSRPPIPEESSKKQEEKEEREAQKLPDDELLKRAKEQGGKPGTKVVSATRYETNKNVSNHAKRRAQGKCDLCGQNAPFLDKKNVPFLETHHIQWMSKGGLDTIDNTAALCPNCHRRMHHLNLDQDVTFLKNKVSRA